MSVTLVINGSRQFEAGGVTAGPIPSDQPEYYHPAVEMGKLFSKRASATIANMIPMQDGTMARVARWQSVVAWRRHRNA